MEITEISEFKWMEILKKLDYNNFFQLPSFLNISAKHFKLKNRYFIIKKKLKEYYFSFQEDNSQISYAPFIGYGGVFSNEPFSFDINLKIKDAIEKIYNTRLRRVKVFPRQIFTNSNFTHQTAQYTAVVPIKETMSEQEKNIHKKTRTAIRYAFKHNILVRKLEEIDLDVFYCIYTETMSRVDSDYLTPKNFFRDLIGMENALFLGAFIDTKLIAASVFFYYKDGMYYWWNSSNSMGKDLSANYALIYSALNYCVSNKFSFLDMASSHSLTIEKPKLRWGAQLIPLIVIG